MSAGQESTSATWYHDPDFDETAVLFLNQDLTDRVYDLVRNFSVGSVVKDAVLSGELDMNLF